MPIRCSITFPRLDSREFGALDYQVTDVAFECQRELGRLADEKIYQNDMALRLARAGLGAQCEVPVEVSFGGFQKTYFLDLVVAGMGVYELKSVARLTNEHAAQLMNYLLLLDCSRGKLVNFRSTAVSSRFVNAPFELSDRRGFSVDRSAWKGCERTVDWIVEMLRDWGTALELPLYHQAIIHHLGGEALVAHNLPLSRSNQHLGNQRFHLLAPDEAFRLTAFNTDMPLYRSEVRRLLSLSPLKCIHWINIGLHKVSFTTINR